MPINLVNKILVKTSYSLAQFVNRYLQANRPELAQEELDTPEGLEQSILAVSTVRENGDIDRRAGIRSTAWDISGKKYRKECFLMGMNGKT